MSFVFKQCIAIHCNVFPNVWGRKKSSVSLRALSALNVFFLSVKVVYQQKKIKLQAETDTLNWEKQAKTTCVEDQRILHCGSLLQLQLELNLDDARNVAKQISTQARRSALVWWCLILTVNFIQSHVARPQIKDTESSSSVQTMLTCFQWPG